MTEMPAPRPPEPAPAWAPPAVDERSTLFPWWTVALIGALSVLFGIGILVWPQITLGALAIVVGFWLLLAGAIRIVGAFLPGRGVGRQVLSGIVGVILVLAGMACLRDLANALAVLSLIVAFTWLFGGLSELIVAFEATGATRTWLLALGILSILVGLLFLFVPELSLAALVLTVGISAIVIGIGELMVGFQLRKVARSA